MLSAIAGSMIRAGGRDDVQRGERQRDAVSDGERRHDERQPPDRAAEQQQPDEKQQMVRADQDVMDARRHEPADDRKDALPGAREVFEARLAAIEDGLRERVALVDVDESLVNRIVRKERCGDGDRSRGAIEAEPDAQPHRLPIREDFRRRPVGRQHASVGGHSSRRDEHADDRLAVARRRRPDRAAARAGRCSARARRRRCAR